nr:hypothetical protein [Marseillevirus cajuinensis]
MSKVCKPVQVFACNIPKVAKDNHKRIRELKENVACPDSEYCLLCMTYLFTDTPDDKCMICDGCMHCYCVSCSRTLGMYQEDGCEIVEGTCVACHLGRRNDYACSGSGKVGKSGDELLWLDSSISLILPVWTESEELNNEKGRCARCYLDLTTYYGKRNNVELNGHVFCGLCEGE